MSTNMRGEFEHWAKSHDQAITASELELMFDAWEECASRQHKQMVYHIIDDCVARLKALEQSACPPRK